MTMNSDENINCQLLRKNIGEFIRDARVSKSLTGAELGKLLNLSQQQISRYENGVTGISIDKLDRILRTLDIEWNDFYFKVIVTADTSISFKDSCHFM